MSVEGAHLHEALLTREHVRGDKEHSYLAFHPCNVVLRHASCPPIEIDGQVYSFRHEGGTGGQLTFARCAYAIVAYEGYDRVHEYLTAMTEFYPQNANDSLRRFESLMERK